MSKNNILVSVIIPNYKRVDELKRAVKSALNQTYQNIEILIVDDASPNINIIEETINDFNDKRIILIKHKDNKGGGASRNTGILQAKGKYIALLDSDDTWEIEKIEEQVKVSEKFDAEILCYTQSMVITNNWTKILPKRGINNQESISEYLFINYQFLPTPSMFISTSLARKCLFNETLPRHQDFDFLFKIEKHKPKIVFIPKPLTNVLWENVDKLLNKGWTSKSSINFFNSYKKHMGKKAYANAFFNSVIYNSVQYESRITSLTYAFQMKSLIFLVNKKILLKYLIRLVIR